ncbi:lipid kinase, YegS/Rv2252/BmrU family [Pseudarcicella hirudinis]|uniref:Lipid kinase, YegS/Rv2252/BmrU family n=2 Tax=Pseudarcicella hirudinis TaxID=1079859 RepID=A0A1I5SVC3_9BACT|nr:lipid kinase, YegS/Rv2252/BmrU family [Pseudarcicella hirudinis]
MNATSGTTTEARKSKIIKLIENQKNVKLIFTEYAGHGAEISKRAVAEKVDKVIAVGGDGTVNEIARELIDSETALGIIPIGSGNGLARHLKIPMKVEKAIQLAVSGKTVKIDACFLNEIPFFCTAGVGFDANVANEFAKQKSRGLKTYAKMSLKYFRTYKPQTYLLEYKGHEMSKTAFTITFANAAQYGNNAMISPDSKIDDGLIDLVVLKPFPFGAAPIIGVRLFKGTLPNSRYVETEKGTSFRLKSEEPLLVHFDGEPHQLSVNEVDVTIRQQCLKVVC